MECVSKSPIPIPQPIFESKYKRRKNNEIEFDINKDISYIYDQIRMLDAPDYPSAFLKINGFILEFSRASFNNKTIISDVKITKE
jgi:methionyl-tRNA formyltransferase